MSLSCSCPSLEYAEWIYYDPVDFTTLRTTRRKRCCSCKKLINLGSDVLKFRRYRYPKSEVELKIYAGLEDTEIPMASWYMCEECGEIYLNLSALAFCIDITESMQKALKEYQAEFANPVWQKEHLKEN